MANPTYAPPGRQAHRTRRRLGSAAAVVVLTAMFATSAAGGASVTTAEPIATAAISEPGPVTFAMAVKPGQPVPLELVTEKSKNEYAGTGAYGQGIDVAIVDTGVTPVSGLDQPGKVVYGPDLSNEGGIDNLANLDTYGHGTHLAGTGWATANADRSVGRRHTTTTPATQRSPGGAEPDELRVSRRWSQRSGCPYRVPPGRLVGR